VSNRLYTSYRHVCFTRIKSGDSLSPATSLTRDVFSLQMHSAAVGNQNVNRPALFDKWNFFIEAARPDFVPKWVLLRRVFFITKTSPDTYLWVSILIRTSLEDWRLNPLSSRRGMWQLWQNVFPKYVKLCVIIKQMGTLKVFSVWTRLGRTGLPDSIWTIIV
jgi:hypothetical protein